MSDVRVVFRQLRHNLSHVAAVIFSLSVGVAVCCATFSAALTLIFADVPGLPERSRLLHVEWIGDPTMSLGEFRALVGSRSPFSTVAAESPRSLPARLPTGATTVTAALVTGDYFRTLGTAAALGRLLEPTDVRDDAHAAVVSDSLWRRTFGSNPSTVGTTIYIDGRPLRVVGIAERGFRGLSTDPALSATGPELWMPMPSTTTDDVSVTVVGRLRPHETVSSARAFVAVLGTRLPSRASVPREPSVVRTYPFGLDWRQNPTESLFAVALYLLVPLAILGIGCANVVNLQLSRATERAKELSIRFTLGASRPRVLWLLGLDVALLAGLAGALGLAGAHGLLSLVSGWVPWNPALDVRIAGFLSALVIAIVGLTGFAPAWLVARDLTAPGLRESVGSVTHRRLRGALVTLQVACSVVLIYVTTLGVHALQANTARIPDAASQMVVADLKLDAASPQGTQRHVLLDAIAERVRRPESQRLVAVASHLTDGALTRYRLSDEQVAATRMAYVNHVSDSWFAVVPSRLLAGRAFDRQGSERDIVVNETLALSLGTLSALGRRVRVGNGDVEATIVGIVEDGMSGPIPVMYTRLGDTASASLVLLARGDHSPDLLAESVRAAIRNVSMDIPIDRVDRLSARLAYGTRGLSDIIAIGSTLSLSAVLLAALGIYAVMSFAVRKRAREIGIRVAVGATHLDVVGLVVREGWWMVVTGLALGLSIALPMGYAMRSVLYGVDLLNPLVLLPAATSLIVVAIIGAAGPTMRALAVQPLTILREE